ncbi:unnamed protein product, partial [Ixodes persulcatus]
QIENVPELPNRCRQCAIVFSLCNCSQHGRSRTSLNSAKTEVHVARRTGLEQNVEPEVHRCHPSKKSLFSFAKRVSMV